VPLAYCCIRALCLGSHIEVFTTKSFSYKKRNRNHLAKRKRRGGGPHTPKPEEKEGMPHHLHCPLAKHREDKDPKYNEEHYKDVA
jgi:hypothetical protein